MQKNSICLKIAHIIKNLENHLSNSVGKIATVCGRYFTMDRDKRWEEAALLPTAADFSDAKKFLESFEVPDDLSGLFPEE